MLCFDLPIRFHLNKSPFTWSLLTHFHGKINITARIRPPPFHNLTNLLISANNICQVYFICENLDILFRFVALRYGGFFYSDIGLVVFHLR
jgi:hypothetical protein